LPPRQEGVSRAPLVGLPESEELCACRAPDVQPVRCVLDVWLEGPCSRRSRSRFAPPLNQSPFVPAEAGTQGPQTRSRASSTRYVLERIQVLGPRFRGDERNKRRCKLSSSRSKMLPVRSRPRRRRRGTVAARRARAGTDPRSS